MILKRKTNYCEILYIYLYSISYPCRTIPYSVFNIKLKFPKRASRSIFEALFYLFATYSMEIRRLIFTAKIIK